VAGRWLGLPSPSPVRALVQSGGASTEASGTGNQSGNGSFNASDAAKDGEVQALLSQSKSGHHMLMNPTDLLLENRETLVVTKSARRPASGLRGNGCVCEQRSDSVPLVYVVAVGAVLFACIQPYFLITQLKQAGTGRHH